MIIDSITLAVALLQLSGAGCSKDSSAGRAAGLPPQPVLAAAATAASRPTSNDLPPPTPAQQQALERALAVHPQNAPAEPETVPQVPDEKETISGTIVLPAANRAKVARGDVMFLAARRAGGPPGPGSMLAVQKLTAEDFPMRFTISSRDAMIPGVPFEGLMSITVRVDKDGDAMTRLKGDVYGQANNVKVGSQKVVVSLDTVATEDRTLAPPSGTMGGMLPSGHP
jgi:cytochrome c-type biogenesis protein CcmH